MLEGPRVRAGALGCFLAEDDTEAEALESLALVAGVARPPSSWGLVRCLVAELVEGWCRGMVRGVELE